MKATPRNMRTLAEQNNEPICVPGVFAYSPETGERCSASASDYFAMPDDEPLRDEEGNEMVLAREDTRVFEITDQPDN